MCLSGMVIETLEVLGHDDNRELMPKVVETQWHQLYESMWSFWAYKDEAPPSWWWNQTLLSPFSSLQSALWPQPFMGCCRTIGETCVHRMLTDYGIFGRLAYHAKVALSKVIVRTVAIILHPSWLVGHWSLVHIATWNRQNVSSEFSRLVEYFKVWHFEIWGKWYRLDPRWIRLNSGSSYCNLFFLVVYGYQWVQ